MKAINTKWLVVGVAYAVIGFVGCGPKVEMKQFDMKGGTSSDDEQKIKGYMEAAGIKGEIVAIVSQDEKTWVVTVGQPKPEPGKKPLPIPPNDYLVDKATGKVMSGKPPGQD